MCSEGSILLGQSRIMTTFGGDILAWSATGDINAGRGAKTPVVYTPPRRVYDDIGNVTLSPTLPSQGAGIATLAPIPQVPPGDVNLVAPLGTIDAGEAGIRVSGNVNLAALRIVNAANIEVQGKATGLPAAAVANVSALTSAGAAASAAMVAAADLAKHEKQKQRPSVIQVEVLGFGAAETSERPRAASQLQTGTPDPYDSGKLLQIVGLGDNIDPQQWARLTPSERRVLQQDGH